MTHSVHSWFPDETLYSHVSRFHRLSGNASQRATLDDLFGKGARTHHDFPSHLAHYSERHDGLLGTPGEILFKHTPLSLYLRFQDAKRADMVERESAAALSATTKYRLGLVGSRFGAGHPLKACPQCMSDDTSRYGIAYWHLLHQCPGVYVCLSHDCTLLIGKELPRQQQLVLPCQVKFDDALLRVDEASRSAARSLAVLVRAALALPAEFRFDPRRLGRVLLKGCRENGLVRPESGRLIVRTLARRCLTEARPLRVFPGMAALPASSPEAAAQVRRVLVDTSVRPHPLRFLLLIGTLFNSWASFVTAYAKDSVAHPTLVPSVRDLSLQFFNTSPISVAARSPMEAARFSGPAPSPPTTSRKDR